MKRLLFVISEDRWLISHRLHLAKTAISLGYDVGVLTRETKFKNQIEALGIEFIGWGINRGSINPWLEIKSIWEVYCVLRKFKPDLVHAVALKPVLYSSIASNMVGLKSRVFALAGLGYIFSSNRLKAKVIRPLLKIIFHWMLSGDNVRLILQNPDDRAAIIGMRAIKEENIRLIRGAGVDTDIFSPNPRPLNEQIVILPARLLWSKGVGDFVEVARKIRSKGIQARFALVGEIDSCNPESVSKSQLVEWKSEGVIEVWGVRDDMPEVMRSSSIVCLPSTYGEGLPKVLLEAASCAKPVVAYDIAGCREIVIDGQNGYLILVNDILALTRAIEILLQDKKLQTQMGDKGREIVTKHFSQEIVAEETQQVWEEVLT